MTKLVVVVAALLAAEPDSTVRPCGNAACVSTYQTPVTLGGTVQASQGVWPDGGLARLVPVVAGASLDLTGVQSDPNDGGTTTTPEVIIQSTNTRSATATILSVRNRNTEVFAVKGNGAASPAQVTTSTLLADAGYVDALNVRALVGISVTADAGLFDRVTDRLTTSITVIADGGTFDNVAVRVITASSPLTSSTFPCDGGTPADTWTVTSGVNCVCGGLGAACTVSGTTLTTHCVAGDTVNVGRICL